ncbi:MAG TPA: mechanosensitive ion channel [bacterium]|nr:mechanosensitive ion channel [bacterium]HOL47888.1 mechanosensitive ion channel [bacterium]HPQ19674.1 mechanosensitive ion channel [bacterium]
MEIKKFLDFYHWENLLSNNKFILFIIIIVVCWLFIKSCSYILYLTISNLKTRYVLKKLVNYLIIFLCILVGLKIWLKEIKSYSIYLGILSAAFAIVLKDPISDIAGWFFLIWKKPFKVGDRIQIDNFIGDVIDIKMFKFLILEVGGWCGDEQSTGRIIYIPNSKILNSLIVNYTQGFHYIWNEIPVLITFESNWKKAKEILQKIAENYAEHKKAEIEKKLNEANKKFFIFYKNLTPTVYTSVKDSGVLLTIRYLCSPRNKRNSAQQIWEEILEEFKKHNDIDFAYPT